MALAFRANQNDGLRWDKAVPEDVRRATSSFFNEGIAPDVFHNSVGSPSEDPHFSSKVRDDATLRFTQFCFSEDSVGEGV